VKVLVTGAGGFLGFHVVETLLARGHDVLAGARRESSELQHLRARVVKLDLADRDELREACKGRDAVVHVAAKTGVWGPRAEFHATNVVGTENVIAACVSRKVPRLVLTSSPSVVFDGRDHVDASNDLPYPSRYLCEYPRTKAIAEQLVLAANGRFGLATCALRPHLIFGARDPHLVPRILERARAKKLLRVGAGTNRVTLCAVENAALAHALAVESLTRDAPHAGNAYFVGQEQSVALWPWISELLERLRLPPIERSLSEGTAYALGAACELAWAVARRSSEPPMTRFVARVLSRSHSYSMAPAREAFGYREHVSTAAAVDAVVAAHAGR
jgi:nucleoside-diphosphate-sugar epimerase